MGRDSNGLHHVNIGSFQWALMATIQVTCCSGDQTKFLCQYGTGMRGFSRFRSLSYQRSLQLNYAYPACYPSVKEKVIDMAWRKSNRKRSQYSL